MDCCKSTEDKVFWISVVELVIGLVFWIWALFDLLDGDFDIGFIVFVLIIVAGTLGIKLTWKNARRPKNQLEALWIMFLCAHAIVAVLYLLAALGVALGRSFGTFVLNVILCVLWAISGYFVVTICRRFRDQNA